MTHGVIENSVNLVYAGQSGAMDETLADSFGNAIETDAYGIPTDNPDSARWARRNAGRRPRAPVRCAT
ncbi:M4 family metallopeptidase [Streptomyces sp. NPDC059991]|uniref:M4 family metallopeptidase n=1 Tax=Streptomyces sp. NPDC059991 TaxID=3347028 RepID=UPI0036AC7ADF